MSDVLDAAAAVVHDARATTTAPLSGSSTVLAITMRGLEQISGLKLLRNIDLNGLANLFSVVQQGHDITCTDCVKHEAKIPDQLIAFVASTFELDLVSVALAIKFGNPDMAFGGAR